MKYRIIVVTVMLLFPFLTQAQMLIGKVIDGQKLPIPFANVILLNTDSLSLAGSISNGDGIFQLALSDDATLLKISCIGYQEKIISLNANQIDMGEILLNEDTYMLGEVVIKGNLPKTYIKGDATVTKVAGSVLEKAGSAQEVLASIPGIIRKGEDISVFGRGAPVVYINNREVRDITELNQLTSDNMKLPHPIPYQGSKRNLADKILRFFPAKFDRLIEPFAGSAAISIASAFYFKAGRFVINDINKPLTDLWNTIINQPQQIVSQYNDIWHGQHGNEEEYYYEIRNKFNETQQPEYLLFLLAKCVKAAVRYNAQGNFNQSPDKRRLGRNPRMMRDDILGASRLLKGKTEICSTDYSFILENATSNDLIYMDPPYQGTGQNGGFNYAGNIDFDDFVISLYGLNKRNIPYILSFDGRTGGKTFGKPLPNALSLTKIEINAGRSTQATLLNREEYTYEAIYLSPSLTERIDMCRVKQLLENSAREETNDIN